MSDIAACILQGTLLNSWDGVRVNALACRGDARGVLAADTHHRVRAYDFTDLADRNLSVLYYTIPLLIIISWNTST